MHKTPEIQEYLHKKTHNLKLVQYPPTATSGNTACSKYPTICIPKIDATIAKEYIFEVFCKLNIGRIEKITEVPIHNDSNYKRIFIKMKWNTVNIQSVFIMERFKNGKNVKIVHNAPWYWRIVSSSLERVGLPKVE